MNRPTRRSSLFPSKSLSTSRTSGPKKAVRRRVHAPLVTERLEDRTVFSISGVGEIPSLISGPAEQSLFAVGASEETLHAASTSVSSRFERFALDGTDAVQHVRFELLPQSLPYSGDAALAIYDENGNLLAKADNDPNASQPSRESLSVDLEAGKPYILGTFFGPTGGPADFRRLVGTTQGVNATIAIDPASGLATLEANSGENTFNSPADVDYYLLDLTNGGNLGTATISPTGLDVQIFATLYRRDNTTSPWKAIEEQSDATGAPVLLTLTPTAGRSLSDVQYMLGVAPVGFNTAARSYRIDVAANVLSPATVNTVGATDLGAPAPTSLGQAQISQNGTLLEESQVVYRLQAPAAGQMTITLAANGFEPMASVYSADGMTLLAASSNTGASLQLSIRAAMAGEAFLVRVADLGGDDGGTFTLQATAQYEPMAIAVQAGVTTLPGIELGPNRAASYRITPTAGADALVLSLVPQAATAAKITIVGENFAPITRQAAAGETLFFPADLAGQSGAIDVFITGGDVETSATLSIGLLDLAATINPNQLPGGQLNLNTGDLSVTQSLGAFGATTGIRYYQMVTPPGQNATALSADGAAAILAVYRQDGPSLKLVDYVLPGANGRAELSANLAADEQHAVVAYSLSFGGGGDTTLSIDATQPYGVGVAMVPDPPPQLPENPNPGQNNTWSSLLRVAGIQLKSVYQQNLWRTILPANIKSGAATPTQLTIKPVSGGTLQLVVTMYDKNRNLIDGPRTNPPGVNGVFTIPEAVMLAHKGEEVYLHVEAAAGQLLGDGVYTVELRVPTENPGPFEVKEKYWKFQPSTVVPSQAGDLVGVLPSFELNDAGQPTVFFQAKDIIQNQHGAGSAQGEFTSSLPYSTDIDPSPSRTGNPGAIDVFRFWAINPGDVRVWSTLRDGSKANTNLKLYSAHFSASGTVDYLVELPEVGPSFDWYPADRSEIDAQSLVKSFRLLDYNSGGPHLTEYRTGGGMYFAVVKNQEGTTGEYEIHVETADMPLLGANNPSATVSTYNQALDNQVTYLPSGGSATLKMNYTESFNDFVGYFPIQLPEHHTNGLTIKSEVGAFWDLELFDAAGNRLPGSVTLQSAGGMHSLGIFSVPADVTTVYVRARESSEVGNASAKLTVTMNLDANLPAGFVAPPSTIPATLTHKTLWTTPMADGSIADSFAAVGTKTYAFQASAGAPLSVSVTPQNASQVELLWGVYVDGKLLAWDRTTLAGDAANTTATLVLPKLRIADPEQRDYVYDRAPYHDVVVRVQALSLNGGPANFTVAVDSAATLPMRDTSNATVGMIDLSTGTAGATVSGVQWWSLAVPDHTSAPVQLTMIPSGAGGNQVRYELYAADGTLVMAETKSAPTSAVFTLNGLEDGRTYYLRAGVVADAPRTMSLTASVTLNKYAESCGQFLCVPINAVPADELGLFDQPLSRMLIRPDGNLPQQFPTTASKTLAATSFWVGQGGMSSFTAQIGGNAANPYVALYRGVFECRNETCGGGLDFYLELVDFVNNADDESGGVYRINRDLEPGMYALIAERANTTGTASANILFDLPNYATEEITLDPNGGSSAYTNLRDVDSADYAHPEREDILDSFRTSVYHVVAPAASQSNMTVEAHSLTYAYTSAEVGTATVAVFQHFPAVNSYGRVLPAGDDLLNPGFVVDPDPNDDINDSAFVDVADGTPGKEYWIVVNRDHLANDVAIAASFVVPQSGTPDLVVSDPELLPDGGKTRVLFEISNEGYALSPTTTARFEYSDTSASVSNPNWTTSDRVEHVLAPFASRTLGFTWKPVRPTDVVRYSTDFVPGNPDGTIAEIKETNNTADEILSSVDPVIPTLTISLGDVLMDGTAPNDNVWGRYIAGVYATSDVWVNINDTPGDTYQVLGHYPSTVASPVGQYYIGGAGTAQKFHQFNFGGLKATAPNNPNEFRLRPIDQYGLEGPEVIQKVNVVHRPGWLSGDNTNITFDQDTHRYEFEFRNKALDWHDTIDGLADGGIQVPFIGDKKNEVSAEIVTTGTATLNPTLPVTPEVTARLLVKILGENIVDETYTSSGQVSDYVSLDTYLVLDPASLDAEAMAISLHLDDLPIARWESPEITLFSYGVPGVASLNANLQFFVEGSVDAAVTFGIDANVLQDPTNPPAVVGLLAPSYVAPAITAGLGIEGEVEFLGFDIAELEGHISFTIQPAYGLSTPITQLVPFEDFFDESCLQINGYLGGGISADVLGFEVFSYDFPSLEIPLSSGCNVTGVEPPGGSLAAVAAQGPAFGPAADPVVGWTLPGGDMPVGVLKTDAKPQIVIDPLTGDALFVQAVDVDPNPNVTRQNFVYARRTNGVWSPLSPLGEVGHVSNPVLKLTGDGPGSRAVLVYQSLDVSGGASADPAAMTRNEYLTGQDLRYRYFDGSSWGAPQTLIGDNHYDFGHSVAFNSTGQGMVAWTHNTSAAPLGMDGTFDGTGTETYAAIWDPTLHRFDAPTALSANSVADSKPAAYVDASGTRYVAWVRQADGVQQIVASRYQNGAWSAAAVLPTTGLNPNGRIGSLAFGSDGPSRIDLLISETTPLNTDGAAQTRLLNRPSTIAGYTSSVALETVTSGAGVANLQTAQSPDGALVAYWQQGSGDQFDIYTSRLGPVSSGNATWTTPVPLTHGDATERSASLAFETNGDYSLVFDTIGPTGAAGPNVGNPSAGSVQSTTVGEQAELGFSRPLTFPQNGIAPIGSDLASDAQIINRGLSTDAVLIEFLTRTAGGPNVVVASRIVVLGPGDTLDLNQSFTVLAGAAEYSVRLTSLGGEELIGADDNVSTTTLLGALDLAVQSVSLSNTHPIAGQVVNVNVVVRNNSGVATPATDARVYLGDPAMTHTASSVLGTVALPSIAPNSTTQVSILWTVPAAGGEFVLTAIADASNHVAEVTDQNNDGRAFVSVQPDGGVTGVTATVLNASGVNNVRVDATIANVGVAALANVKVRLFASRNDGPLVDVGVKTIPALAVGGSVNLNWLSAGLAGVNHYQVVVDPDQQQSDESYLNNVGHASVTIQGLADLAVTDMVRTPNVQALKQGTPITLLANVANSGIATAEFVLVEVFARNATAGNLLLAQTTLGNVGPLSSQPVNFVLDTRQLKGETEICVVVDRGEEILETSDLNNESCFRVSFTPVPRGDFNFDGLVNATDIDLIHAALNGPQPADLLFDVTGNGQVQRSDVDVLVHEILGTEYGDANLDRRVDRRDVALLANNFGYSGTPAWAKGDTTGDGRAGLADLAKLQQGFGFVSPAAAGAVMQNAAAAHATLRAKRPARAAVTAHDVAAAVDISFTATDAAPAVSRRAMRIAR